MAEVAEPMGQTAEAGSVREGKYLTCCLVDAEYCIGILKIKEIIGMMAFI